MSPARDGRRRTLTAITVLGLTIVAIGSGRLALQRAPQSPAPASADRQAPPLQDALPSAAEQGPGAGIVIGRIVDRDTGLAVRDAGVTVLELGRRSISLPDGRFRFDGLAPGRYTLIFGPAEDYVPRTVDLKVLPAGTDLGIVGLVPALPPIPVAAAEGGSLSACGDSRLRLEPASLPEDLALGFTCLERLDDLPAPPPAGRLPLAAVHLSPESLGLIVPGRLRLALPAQPRYGVGVSLDLLRLDLDRGLWRPAGALVVSDDGRSAEGDLLALGDYLVAAPPFGAFAAAAGTGEGGLLRLSTSVTVDGTPAERVDPGTAVVYLDMAFGGLDAGPVQVRTVDAAGNLLFEGSLVYGGSGSARLAMSLDEGPWGTGEYLSTVYFGPGPQIQSIPWRVAEAPATAPPAAWIDAGIPGQAAAATGSAALPPAPSFGGSCVAPAAWWAYLVQPGDSLGALAARTGSTVAALQAANCLKGDAILAGQTLFVPTIVYKQKPPLPGSWQGVAPATAPPPDGPTQGGPSAGPSRAPVLPPYVKATRPPDPTLAPRPTDPPAWPRSAPPPLPEPQRFDAPPAPSPVPPLQGQGAGSWKEPRGPDPTLAPRPALP